MKNNYTFFKLPKKTILACLVGICLFKQSFSQIKPLAEVYYSVAAFGVKSKITITEDWILRTGISLNVDSFCTCTKYKIYKKYLIGNYKFYVVSSYYGYGYEVISFQKKNKRLNKVAFTEVLAWSSGSPIKRRHIRKQYLNPIILPYAQLFTDEEIKKIDTYSTLQTASTLQILNTLDTLIKLKYDWLNLENQDPNVGKLGVHFFTESISQALIRNQINPFFKENFFEVIKARPDNEKILDKLNKFWSIKISA